MCIVTSYLSVPSKELLYNKNLVFNRKNELEYNPYFCFYFCYSNNTKNNKKKNTNTIVLVILILIFKLKYINIL